MRLQAQVPLRMAEAVSNGRSRIGGTVGPIHRLKPEMGEFQHFQIRGIQSRLGKYELEFRSGSQTQGRARFWLTQIQCRPGGAGSAPLLSTAV